MKRGDLYRWRAPSINQDLTVRRVASDGSWADVFIYDNRTRTSQSMRTGLPLGDEWVKVSA